MANPQVTRLRCSSICQAIWIGHKVCSAGNYYCPGQFFLEDQHGQYYSLIRTRGTMTARDRRWQDTKEYPTIVPWSLIKRHLLDCLVAYLKSPKSLCSPNSTRRRLNVHLETRRIWAIFIQMKADDRRWVLIECPERFGQFDKWFRVYRPYKRLMPRSISSKAALTIGSTCWKARMR